MAKKKKPPIKRTRTRPGFMVRLPEYIETRIRAFARENRRTIVAEVELAIERHLQEHSR